MAEGADKRAKSSVNTVGASNHSDKDREELDFYQTPSFATQSLLDLGIIEAHNIWEPMAGNGAIAKPLNYDKDYIDDATREAWIEEIKAGRAVAVHFTQDEIAAGEVPTLYKRHIAAESK